MAMPDPFDVRWRDRVGRGQNRQQHREGDEYRLDPNQLGSQHLLGQRAFEIGRYRRPLLASNIPESSHCLAMSFRGDAQHRTRISKFPDAQLRV